MLKPIQLYDQTDIAQLDQRLREERTWTNFSPEYKKLLNITISLIDQLRWEWHDRQEEYESLTNQLDTLNDVNEDLEAEVDSLRDELVEAESDKQ